MNTSVVVVTTDSGVHITIKAVATDSAVTALSVAIIVILKCTNLTIERLVVYT